MPYDYGAWEPVIGLEIHVQLKTATKMFCGCKAEYGAPPNTHVCPVCLGLPGALPVPNAKAIEQAIKAGLALQCTVAAFTKFDRKNYYYPDLPKNYQISQYDLPFSAGGKIAITLPDGAPKTIGITRAHLEEDTGKLSHGAHLPGSQVDLNRAGTPLLEIVSEPDLRAPDEARIYMETIKDRMEFLDIGDCNLQEGSLRCDVNVSVRKKGATAFGTKVEIKNINSFRYVELAVDFEIKRQIGLIEAGKGAEIRQSTRGFDSTNNTTFHQRSKEIADEYRYFPDPDLPPMTFTPAYIEKLRSELKRTPAELKADMIERLGLTEEVVEQLTRRYQKTKYFEAVVAAGAPARTAAIWVINEIGSIKGLPDDLAGLQVTPEQLAALIDMVEKKQLTRNIAREKVFPVMVETGRDPQAIAKELDLLSAPGGDTGALTAAVQAVIIANPKQVAEYKAGKEATFNWLLGQVMKQGRGKFQADAVREALTTALRS
ncbi:MAG: Asp-tRNA(Asn)/Glu-tRNA(Gln) amidotransferase subunit GatB [Planctomycetota bacterium]